MNRNKKKCSLCEGLFPKGTIRSFGRKELRYPIEFNITNNIKIPIKWKWIHPELAKFNSVEKKGKFIEGYDWSKKGKVKLCKNCREKIGLE